MPWNGLQLKALRKKEGIGLHELAAKLTHLPGCTKTVHGPTLSKAERGTMPEERIVLLLTKHYGVSKETFFAAGVPKGYVDAPARRVRGARKSSGASALPPVKLEGDGFMTMEANEFAREDLCMLEEGKTYVLKNAGTVQLTGSWGKGWKQSPRPTLVEGIYKGFNRSSYCAKATFSFLIGGEEELFNTVTCKQGTLPSSGAPPKNKRKPHKKGN